MFLTSGYGNALLGFEPTALQSQKLKELKEGENISFITLHPRLKGIFYAVHEYKEPEGLPEVQGAVSRWAVNFHQEQCYTLEMLEVSFQTWLSVTCQKYFSFYCEAKKPRFALHKPLIFERQFLNDALPSKVGF